MGAIHTHVTRVPTLRKLDGVSEGAGSQFLDGDGRFPNHIPNPENAAAMEAGCNMVRTSKVTAMACNMFSMKFFNK